MHDIRESLFECRFDSASRRSVAHVRAWDAKEAAQLFELELRGDGIHEEGEVIVSPVHGDRRPLTRTHLPKHDA
ncbi:MAG TPA: hypothetical protein VF841_05895 [Anaeromyxobacter sp.]